MGASAHYVEEGRANTGWPCQKKKNKQGGGK
jgi:hypothetical protein